MKPYRGKVRCTINGYPVCFMDHEYCTNKLCYYHVPLFEYGNCLLRVDRPHTLSEIGRVLGVSKERVRQLVGALIVKSRTTLTQG